MKEDAHASPSGSKIDTVGYALAIGGAALFSTKGIFIKLAFAQGVSTEAALALRMLVALPVYLAILVTILRRNPALGASLSPRLIGSSMAVGALGYYLSSYLDFAGLAFVSAQYERLVLFTYPFFVLLFGVWFFGERMVWRLVPALLITYGGLLVIFAWNLAVNPEGLLIGTILVLGSGTDLRLLPASGKAADEADRLGAFYLHRHVHRRSPCHYPEPRRRRPRDLCRLHALYLVAWPDAGHFRHRAALVPAQHRH
ncbi:DMT family transporter [Devosia chinhatensis]|uniref:DMT family transporter n=1 Tax=Devosia aurantiaca TaxID=2714858 RepID=A0A6M1SIA2_9HYPH|nr:DMT family transporter [Devosia aurantiaca]